MPGASSNRCKLSQDLAAIELNSLDGATLPTDNAPVELLPILEEFNRMVVAAPLSHQPKTIRLHHQP